MRLLPVIFLVAACSRPAPPGPGGTTFARAAPAVGDTRRTTAELTLRATLDGGAPVAADERSTRTEEVLAVAAGAPAKKKVTVEVDGKPPATEVVEGPAALDPVAAALPDAPLAPGARVDALARAVAERMKGVEVTRATVTFEGASGDDATFDVALALRKTEASIAMTMDLAGKLHVSTKTRAATSMHLAGPVTLTGAEIAGAGTVTIDVAEK